MLSFFNKQRIDIKQIKEWKKTDEPFYAPGVLVHVKSGKGILREVFSESGEKSFMALMMGKKPLIQFQGDDYYCPTCEKIIRAGYGLGHKEWEKMKLAEKENVAAMPLDQQVEKLYPLLNLLAEGYYVILDTALYPTDGNGQFFWEPPSDVPATGSCVYYYGECDWGYLRPHFTLASEPPEKCDKSRVEYYLNHPEEKAVAYYLDGYMTVLLDGHHKTFAAALRHEQVKALVIMPLTSKSLMDTYKGLGFGDMVFKKEELNLTDEAWREAGNHTELLNKKQTKKIEEAFKKAAHKASQKSYDQRKGKANFPFAIEGLAQYYPSASEVADIERAGQIKEETLEQILNQQKSCTDKEVCILMRALRALHHPKTYEMGAFFSSQPYDGEILYEVIEVLLELPRTESLEALLIQRMVELEERYPEIKKLIMKAL